MEEDPKTLSEAMALRDIAFWKKVISDQMDSLLSNQTWKLVDLLIRSNLNQLNVLLIGSNLNQLNVNGYSIIIQPQSIVQINFFKLVKLSKIQTISYFP